ncbi:MAG TPA: YceK/YidQ family lipoprotein [Verrucomicrobiae bacterium]|nr:YceK/YidQ family lipoprotein [Verrucomicrobiae bacterium]
MRRITLTAVLVTLAVVSTGCASTLIRGAQGLTTSPEPLGAYPGVRADVSGIVCAPAAALKEDPFALCLIPLSAADLPLSAVVDTGLLPFETWKLWSPSAKEPTQKPKKT